jgi:UDP-N-acetyl-D-galactosamine dehydrogenase
MKTISIIGLGYVGLPLAVAFAKKYKVIGFDISQKRIDELNKGVDSTLEISEEELKSVLPQFNKELTNNQLLITNKLEDIASCNIFIVTVPTPIDKHKNPDLTPLIKASESVGSVLKKGDIVIYESTVFPGCTEEVCVPILEEKSNLKFNKDFFVGYSPERINPGDKEHTVTKIKKVTSGSTPEVAKEINELYASIIEAGTHLAPSIKVAEAAKVIENAQRDINIAFVNELALIFDKLNIDTKDVLEAAGTKWNFLKFTPGLVGGHCQIGSEYIFVRENQKIKTYTFEEFNNYLNSRDINYLGTTFRFPHEKIEVLSFNPFKGFVFERANVFTKRKYNKFIKIKTSTGDILTFSDKLSVLINCEQAFINGAGVFSSPKP